MIFIFLLSKENLKIAEAEVLSILPAIKVKCIDGLLELETDKLDSDFLTSRLGYTKSIYRLLFSCLTKNLEAELEKYPWEKIYKDNFALRVHGDYSEKKLAGYIWRKVHNPKVNLENPKTFIEIFFHKKRAFCCLRIGEIKSKFEDRKAHNRPELHPSSLNPKLARALINLTGIRKGELIDPFCGSGGILIEAGLMGLSATGYDIDDEMLERAKTNLEFYGIKNYSLNNKDALKISRKIKYIVTDLPYGKNTKKIECRKLYRDFLSSLRKILFYRAVVVFPIFNQKNIDYKKMIIKNKLRIINSFDYYIHKSLSKRIFVIEKK